MQVSALESVISKGGKVPENDVLNLIELLMMWLIKLDGVIAEGDVKLQRKMLGFLRSVFIDPNWIGDVEDNDVNLDKSLWQGGRFFLCFGYEDYVRLTNDLSSVFDIYNEECKGIIFSSVLCEMHLSWTDFHSVVGGDHMQLVSLIRIVVDLICI
ncbi:hypothetical protein MRB53_029392 [Persea americana]|uniref:Uncharacterized protein n=1 Tax=Persea americana TaxID=3435 RepID=A0ACC2KIW9_PERAE|nr:hypothetical protein MRB53_029392 [Persea americana]